MLSSVATAGLGMLFWAVAAREFDPAEVGRASAGSSAMLLLATLGQFSLTSVFARVLPTMARDRVRFLSAGYALVAIASLLLTAGFFAGGLGDEIMAARPVTVLVFGLGVAATAISVVQDSALVALGRAGWVPAKNTALALARITLLPILAGTSLPAPIVTAWAVPTVVAVVVPGIMLPGRCDPARVESAGDAAAPPPREIVRLIGGQYANGVVTAVTLFSPPVLVTSVLGPEANAAFFLPWTIATALLGLLWNVVVPFVVEAGAGREDLGANVRLMIRTGTLITVGGAAALLLLGPVLLVVAGSDYAAGGTPVLRLLAAALPFAAIGTYFNAAELLRLRSSGTLLTKIIAAVLFLGGAVPAMHATGVAGAAAAYLFSQVAVGVLLLGPVVSWYRGHVRPAPPGPVRRGLAPRPATKDATP
jgi:O-antigen/teichoic acid export membrane protein